MKILNKTTDKKKKIISNYNKTAHFYDNRYRKIQEQKYKVILNKNCRLKRKVILDVGCGTGLFIEFIIELKEQRNYFPFIYVGTDISWKMLKIFRIKLQKLKLKSEFNLILADIENLPFRDDIFHSIFSLTSFQNLPNIDIGIKNLYRVGQNEGEITISILKKKSNLTELKNLLNPIIESLTSINKEDLEDFIIQGKILKK
ncbi:MAG: class I SAM-dependent methyltransferase [Promethearchaeota archaeon]